MKKKNKRKNQIIEIVLKVKKHPVKRHATNDTVTPRSGKTRLGRCVKCT